MPQDSYNMLQMILYFLLAVTYTMAARQHFGILLEGLKPEGQACRAEQRLSLHPIAQTTCSSAVGSVHSMATSDAVSIEQVVCTTSCLKACDLAELC